MLACTLIACSNYVINEVLDAPQDRFHPTKKNRPVPMGLVNIPLAYIQWLAMMAAGMAAALAVSKSFAIVAAALWCMGCIYNIPPIRTKEIPYLDVLSEAVNNPLRFLLGWYMVTDQILPPVSLAISYWMVGSYFMAIKRFSEYRQIGDATAGAYRQSFKYYSGSKLLVSIVFYGSTSMLFFGTFVARYRLELILAYPLVALVMAVYFFLSFENDSAVQNPEYLHREKRLMIPVVLCAFVLATLMFVDVPRLRQLFAPSVFATPHFPVLQLR
jgi:decaprenyl-phosphate phosphoribosyltransferase